MLYQVESTERKAGDRVGPVVRLSHGNGLCNAEIWVAHGFNCTQWQVASEGKMYDILFSAPDWLTNPVPTRSGIPILFPFPNRIRDGKYTFAGKEYQLPTNDSTKKNAIHGYAPRYPWRIVDQGATDFGAYVSGEFRPSIDAPEVEKFWPADYGFHVTYRLGHHTLTIETKVTNRSSSILPFGLGFHPWFRFPFASQEGDISRYRFHMPAHSLWKLEESLPTGEKIPIPEELDWSRPKLLGNVTLDTVYTDLFDVDDPQGKMHLRAELRHADTLGALQIWTTADFRDMVLFTPVHRKAFCIEPYTCPTDAIHLQERGIDSGWKELGSGQEWTGKVEIRWDEKATGVLKI
jgi:aldose 1-epimerase